MTHRSTNGDQESIVPAWQDPVVDAGTIPFPEEVNTASAMGSGESGRSGSGESEGIGQKVSSTISGMQDSASEMASQATTKVDEGKEKAASGMETIADQLQSRTEGMGEGRMKDVAGMAAEHLQTGAEIMRSKSTDELVTDLEGLIRRKPMESLLVAAGIGFLLARKV